MCCFNSKISNENSGLKDTNDSLNLKLEEISQEMADLTKVSFVSNLSKQISDKDHQIITLKRKLCKLESENKELTKVKKLIQQRISLLKFHLYRKRIKKCECWNI